MKLMIVLCALVAVAVAAPASVSIEIPQLVATRQVSIVRSEFKREDDGSYNFYIETDDGSVRQETGELKEVPDEKGELVKVIIVRGLYTTVDKDGLPHTITYTADQNGYLAEGDDIPKVPEAAPEVVVVQE